MGAGPQQRNPKILLEKLLKTCNGRELAPDELASVASVSHGQRPMVVTVSLGKVQDGLIELGHYEFGSIPEAQGFKRGIEECKAELLRSGIGLEGTVSETEGLNGGTLSICRWDPDKYNRNYHS